MTQADESIDWIDMWGVLLHATTSSSNIYERYYCSRVATGVDEYPADLNIRRFGKRRQENNAGALLVWEQLYTTEFPCPLFINAMFKQNIPYS